MSSIQIKEFTKKYKEITAVKNICLKVEEGELFGMIGPDGAGKTTLLRSICTLLQPTGGKITVEGYDTATHISDIRKILGYMPQRFSLYQDLTVEQNLNFFADLFNVPKDKRKPRFELLYQFSRLETFKNRLAGALSGGMKQKLALSCALIHTPKVLILDEPTYGVDPLSRQEFWEILKSIQKEGTTTLVSTAYMEEAEICDRVALLHRGRIVSTGKPQDIRNQYSYPLYRIEGKNLYQLKQYFDQLTIVHDTQLFGNAIHVSFNAVPESTNWHKWQEETSQNLLNWIPHSPSMEDVFMDFISGEKN